MSDRKPAALGSDGATLPDPHASRGAEVSRPDESSPARTRPAALSLVDANDEDKAPERLHIGQVIAEKYRIDEVIGRGGMGVVLRARHLALDEPVVIKVLRPSLMDKDGMVARFTREARATSKIKSQHVVRVMDIDALDSGVPYIVMEWLEGTDLAAVLGEQGKLPIETAVRYILDACDAIGEAHGLGIIHRDLKPANLFLAQRRDGKQEIKVLDFGISKIEGATVAAEDSTQPGMMMGSPKFMAPEQMLSMSDVDARADVWALGAILYNMLTGSPPFVAPNLPQVCALVLNAEPVPPSVHVPEIPVDLETVVLRCLKKKLAERFADVAKLREALAPFGPDAPPASRQASELVKSSALEIAPDHITPTPPPASPRTSITASMDAPPAASKRRSPRRLLGWLALALLLGAAGVALAPRLKPMIAEAIQPKPQHTPSATAPPPADTQPADAPPAGTSSAAVSTALPAPSLTNDAAATSAPSTPPAAATRPAAERKPSGSSGKGRKPSSKNDPFGGSRN